MTFFKRNALQCRILKLWDAHVWDSYSSSQGEGGLVQYEGVGVGRKSFVLYASCDKFNAGGLRSNNWKGLANVSRVQC